MNFTPESVDGNGTLTINRGCLPGVRQLDKRGIIAGDLLIYVDAGDADWSSDENNSRRDRERFISA